MKRFISILSLMVGASVASYAGLITSSAGLVGTSYLQDFDGAAVGAFPLNSFLLNGVTVTVSSSGPGGAGSNTGSTASIASGSLADFNTNRYVNTFNVGQDSSLGSSFARNLTFTFSAPVSGFFVDYYFSNSASNFISLNGVQQGNLGIGAGGIGFSGDVINTVSFTILGNDTTNAGGDSVLFDNLRVVTAATTDGGDGDVDGGDGDGGEPNVVPEPSTYALMGASLLALAYSRRKK